VFDELEDHALVGAVDGGEIFRSDGEESAQVLTMTVRRLLDRCEAGCVNLVLPVPASVASAHLSHLSPCSIARSSSIP
jgi:hypothetical protein